MRATIAPEAIHLSGLLDLPWSQPLAVWRDPRLVVLRNEGLHRHVVRFVEDGGRIWAIKELPEELARREYRVLGHLADVGVPCVTVYGVVSDRGPGVEAALVTGFLDYSYTYRTVFSRPRRPHPRRRLVDALVQLFVRLHLANVYWGDCSLSNALFRLDAGQLAAYLVDAETAEIVPEISGGQRHTDLMLAGQNILGELLDLQAAGMLGTDIDPEQTVTDIEAGYESLWSELTSDWLVEAGEEQDRARERLRRLNELGFDVDEIELVDAGSGRTRLRVTTKVNETGHHRQLLYQRTGLLTEENQARRLLNDIASYRAWLERSEERPIPEVVATNRWLADVYDPVVSSIPADLHDRLAPAEVFHEVLEHRWYMARARQHDVSTPDATADYVAAILPAVADGPVSSGKGGAGDAEREPGAGTRDPPVGG